MLLASAGLLLRSYSNLNHLDAGFDANNTYVFHVGAAWDEDRGRVGRLQEKVLEELRKQPGVIDAGVTNFLPASGASMRYSVNVDGAGKAMLGLRSVSPGYLKALEVPLLAGDWCGELQSGPHPTRQAMVNRRFAEVYGNPLGRKVDGAEIVGVVGDVREDALNTGAFPYSYTCAVGGDWPDPEYVVRSKIDPRGQLRALVRQVDPSRAVFGVKTLREGVESDLERPRTNAALVTVFGLASMLLAAAGLYGLVTQMVTARRQEIGVKMALGAEPSRIVLGVVASAGSLAGMGIAAGLVGMLAVHRLLRSFLFGVGGADGWVLVMAAGLVALVSLLAALGPANRAAQIDPAEAIRGE
jgi:hypothetical protein